MKPSDDKSRRKAIEFLKKFRDKRRRAGGSSGKSDLQVLRGKRNWQTPAIVFVVIIGSMRVMGWHQVPLWFIWIPVGCFVVAAYIVFFRQRKIDAAIRLFDEWILPSGKELLARIEEGGEAMTGSRRKAMEVLRKFSDHRGKYDAYSPRTDLQALRESYYQSPPFLAPMYFLLVTISLRNWTSWVFWLLMLGAVIGAVWGVVCQRRLGSALELFEEGAPSAEEVLSRMGDARAKLEGEVAMSV